MASTEILKNLIKINGSTSSPKRIDKKETGSSNTTEIKTVKVVTAGSTIVVYDIFKEYGYTGISYTATSANPVAASGGSIVPYVSANKIGNSGATYGSLTLTSTTGVSGAKLSYSLSLASGVTGVSVNSKSGIVTVDNRGTTEDSNFDPVKVGSVKLSITGISTPLVSNNIYREANTATVTYGVPTGTITWNSGTWNGKTYYAPDLSSVSVNNNYKYKSGATKTVSGNYGVNIDANSVGDYDSVRAQVISLINENGYAYEMGEYTLQGSTFNDVGLDFSSFSSSMNTMYGYNIPASVSGIQDSSNIYSALTTLATNGYIPPVEAILPVGLTSEQDWVIKISVFNEDYSMDGELTSEFAIPNSKRVVSSVISRYEPYITLVNEGIDINTTRGYTYNVYNLGGRTIFNNTVKYASGYETNETVTTNEDPRLYTRTILNNKVVDCNNSDFTISISGVHTLTGAPAGAYLKSVVATPTVNENGNLHMQFYMNGSSLEHLIDNPKKAIITLTYHGVSVTKTLVVRNKLTNINIDSLYIDGVRENTFAATTKGTYNVYSEVTLTYMGGATRQMKLSDRKWTGKPDGVTVSGTASSPNLLTGALISSISPDCTTVDIIPNTKTRRRKQNLTMNINTTDYVGGANKTITLTQNAADYEFIDYTVSNRSTYGFEKRNDGQPFNGSKTYYESNNWGVNNSAASAVVKVTLYSGQTGFKIYFKSSGEVPDSGDITAGDYGMVSPLSNTNEFTLGDPNKYDPSGGLRVRFNASDIPLSSYVDGNLVNDQLHCAEYSGLSAGTYYVSVKYIKDSSIHVPNDSMRFIVLPIGDTYNGNIGDGKYHGPAIGSSSSSSGGTTPSTPSTPTTYTIEPNKWPKFTYVDKTTGATISELTPGSNGYPGYLSDNVYFYLGQLSKNGSYISDFGYTSPDAGAFMSTALYNSPYNTHVNGEYFTIDVESADRVINADLGADVATYEPIKFTDAKRFDNTRTFEKDGSKVKIDSSGTSGTDQIVGTVDNGMTNISCDSKHVTFIPTNGECPEIIMIADN